MFPIWLTSRHRSIFISIVQKRYGLINLLYTNLKIIECNVYALIPSDERTKLKLKSLECIFLCFESSVKGYKLWNLVNRKKILSKDVVFD